MKHLIVHDDPPYGTERSFNALRIALALAKHDADAEITVVLMADTALCAKAGQKTPERFHNIEHMLRPVLSAGRRVRICGTCMDARGLTEAEMMEGGRTLDHGRISRGDARRRQGAGVLNAHVLEQGAEF
jgi:uncharacterized protein involved in oxidation of intracellular sulfur